MSSGRGSVRGVVRRKVAVSYVIRDVEEKLNRSGVNKLCLDHTHQLLYTAGRDSIIRSWDVNQNNKSNEIVSELFSINGLDVIFNYVLRSFTVLC